MTSEVDALVIGAGPAGASTAILLAQAGWRVAMVERQVYPRQKVCGECLTAGSLALLDELGVGRAVRDKAGPDLDRVGWMSHARTIVADFPRCKDGPYPYGRALGRDQLDALILERARKVGVRVLQPSRVTAVRGGPGLFDCEIECDEGGAIVVRAFTVVDGHGSWETGPEGVDGPAGQPKPRHTDLFGFKASFRESTLARGLLPVLSFEGGYGGMVLAEDGRLTVACCIRRDTLRVCRARFPGASAGAAIEQYLRDSCWGVREVLSQAERSGPWLSVGALRPGARLGNHGVLRPGLFRVGNAAGEAHPLIGEGINMALQSAFLLSDELLKYPAASIDASRFRKIHRDYGQAWQNAFARRLRLAAAYAHLAMRPALGAAAVLQCWPMLLTRAARWAGKARGPLIPSAPFEGTS